MLGPTLTAAFALPLLGLTPAPPGGLAAPFRVKANNKYIDVEVGHSAPAVADVDGDGLPDLLVGQFGGGKLRVYRNVGTRQEPRFKYWAYLHAAGKLAKVPAS